MIEKIRPVGNPLTIIAIFAALAEVVGTVALGIVDSSNQQIFVWFVMLFPTLLIILFFITLNFNTDVLYAPRDFSNEENYVNIRNRARRVVENVDNLERKFNEAQIAFKHGNNTNSKRDAEQVSDVQILDFKMPHGFSDTLDEIRKSILNTKEAAEDLESISFEKLPRSELQARVIHAIRSAEKPPTFEAICSLVGYKEKDVKRSIEKLIGRGVVAFDESRLGYVLVPKDSPH